MKKILGGAVIALVSISLILFGLIYLASDYKIPTGETGAPAEALRDRIETAVNIADFQRLGAIEFTFVRTNHRHFYDIGRRLVEVRWGDFTVQYDKATYQYRAEQNGQQLTGEDAAAAFATARKYHVNDAFWLNPFAHLRSPGIQLQKIGEQALLITFASGGVTPGDSYLIVTDETGRPTHWKMWTRVVPIKGIEFSFEGWQSVLDRVPLSLEHHSSIIDINLGDVEAYATYPEPGRPDRFAALKGL